MTITLSWQPNLDIEYEEEKGKEKGGREKGEGKREYVLSRFFHECSFFQHFFVQTHRAVCPAFCMNQFINSLNHHHHHH